jgi:hypothetical protein
MYPSENHDKSNVISSPHHPFPEDMALLKPLPVSLNQQGIFINTIQVFWQELRVTKKFCFADRQMR